MTKIHPTAIIDEGAQIGADCEIGPGCHVGPSVVLGDRNILISNVILSGHTTIGDDNKISPYAVLGTDPQDLKFKGEPTRLRIGSRNKIREFVTINRSNNLEEDTVVGDDNLLMEYVHVATTARLATTASLPTWCKWRGIW